ncbi:MAG: ribose-phosphate diphosphokinase [Candidatus Sumerlaeota bacterium]|nr:ribose-phosphate diphosphokinase [Candidatus Sumerlaeota bacterium]
MGADTEMLVFGGSASRRLTQRICAYIGIEPGKNETKRFPDGNIFVRILENVRGRRVYLVQSIAFPPNDSFVELLFWIDAFKRASADTVTALIPYFSYAKGDKKDQPRVSIRARVCADAIQAAGVDRVVCMDLHAAQLQGFFRVPVDDLYAMPLLCERARRYVQDDLVVVSPDPGFVRKARAFASRLNAATAIADETPSAAAGGAQVMEIIGDVKGKRALIVDDFTATGATLVDVAEELVRHGASEVYVAISHGAVNQDAVDRIEASPIKKVLVTDSVETQPAKLTRKFDIVSVAPLLGEAIKRIHNHESLSVLFNA